MTEKICKSPLRNSLGAVVVEARGNKKYMQLADEKYVTSVEISKEFYQAFVKEFSRNEGNKK